MDIQQAIGELARQRRDFSTDEAEQIMNQIMKGEATEAQIGAYLMGLRMKGEAVTEIIGSAEAMRTNSEKVPTKIPSSELLDTCGTGGDHSGTFNISTTVAFVAAGAGVPVAKHGNRAASSKSGSADVLGELGVNLDLTPSQVGQCIDEVGIGFLFAVKLHPAMKYAIHPRRQMKIRTIFNVLGPLTNPANVQRQLLGVFQGANTEVMATALKHLGSKSAIVVSGHDGMDEFTTTGVNQVTHLKEDGSLVNEEIDPQQYGFVMSNLEDLKGDDAVTNARILRAILSGELRDAKRDVVILNAGAALLVAGKSDSLEDGIRLANEVIDSGQALSKLNGLIELSQKLAS